MCGIIGYVGYENAIPKIIKGLSVLEYRGYDSVGIAVNSCDSTIVVKCKGRVGTLADLLYKSEIDNSNCAIGHTRWATHGAPSDINAHPHKYGRTTIVHNGIIENYRSLQREFNIKTNSDTDTEVAAAVIDHFYSIFDSPVEAINQSVAVFEGSYAFGIMFEDIQGQIFALRQGSPLIISHSTDGNFMASDITAILPFTNKYFSLENGDVARIKPDNVDIITNDGTVFSPEWKTTSMTPSDAQKDGFDHFMLKEIHEQPSAIVNAVRCRIKNSIPTYEDDGIDDSYWKSVNNIQVIACGSAIYAGIVGAKLIENLANIPTSVYIASEYRYDPPVCNDEPLVIFISQSGETADTLAALRNAKSKGYKTIGIINTVESTMSREVDKIIYTNAGLEIAVATTKGYCTQVAELYLIAITAALNRGALNKNDAVCFVEELLTDVPRSISAILNNIKNIREIAEEIYECEHLFYIGRGMDHAVALEASLKLKEISYIHSEAYAAGELKHGTISLIESGTPVIAIATSDELYEKLESNIREVKSRGAYVVLICNEVIAEKYVTSADRVISLPSTSKSTSLFSSIVAVQLLAYEIAVLRGCDIDKPRNLAKSVTVE